MKFTLHIENTEEKKPIFSSIFSMDSKTEVLEKFNFLKTYKEKKGVYNLSIDHETEGLFNFSSNSIFLINELKKNILDVIISKTKEYEIQNNLQTN